MRNALIVVLITVAACGAQSTNAPVTPATTPPPPAPAPAPAPAAAASTTTLSTDAEYEAAGTELINEMLRIFRAAANDCDKLAVDVTAFISREDARIQAVNTYEQSHDDARIAFEAKMRDRDEEVNSVLVPALEACDKHEAFDKAMVELQKL